MGVRLVCLPVALLKRGAQLPSGSDLVGVWEMLSLCPLVDLVQGLLPFHGWHQLLNQLPAHVALVHVTFSIYVGVDADLRTSYLDGKGTNRKSQMELVVRRLKNDLNTMSDEQHMDPDFISP